MKKLLIMIITSILVQGCVSTVTSDEIKSQKTELKNEIVSSKSDLQKRILNQNNVVKLGTPFLSSKTIPLSKQAKLPLVFTKASAFARPNDHNLFSITEVAELITKTMGIRVRVRPDVFLPAKLLIPGGTEISSNNESNQNQIFPTDNFNIDSENIEQVKGDYDNRLDFDFKGSLADYLDRVSSKTGINWEWNDDNQELILFRLMRKTFVLDVAPSEIILKSTVNKGSNADASISSEEGGSTSATIAGNANTSLSLKTDAWTSIMNTLNKMKTKAGVVEANPATRTVTVIDTRDVIADVDKFMKLQNEILSRQVLLNIRLLTVALNRINQFDVDGALVIKKLLANGNTKWNLQATGAGQLSETNAGSIVYSVLDSSSRYESSKATIKLLKEVGDIVGEYDQTVPVRNNHSVPISDFTSTAYLAETNSGSSTGDSSSGVPGLTPGTVISGTTIILTPSILSGERLSLLLSIDQSSEPEFTTISSGEGQTLQQIQLPEQSGIKIDTEVAMTNGKTLMLMGLNKNNGTNTDRSGVLSVGKKISSNRTLQVLLVTPQIMGDK